MSKHWFTLVSLKPNAVSKSVMLVSRFLWCSQIRSCDCIYSRTVIPAHLLEVAKTRDPILHTKGLGASSPTKSLLAFFTVSSSLKFNLKFLMAISLDRASLIALILETFNFGIFTALFGTTIRIIFKRRTTNKNPLLLPTLCLIWILSTVIIDIVRAVDAFLDTPGGSLAYYANISNPLQAAKTAVYVTLTLTGDFFVIYRCYIVWNRRWPVVVVPILLWIATGVVGYVTTHAFLQTRQGGIFLEALEPWVTSFICMTLSTNVVSTVLIAYRILRTRMALHKLNTGNSRVYSALVIFLESAATYSAAVIVLVTVYLLNSNAQYIVLDLTAPLIGITFSMIILRLAVTSTGEESSRGVTLSNSYPLSAAVNVSRLVEVTGHGDGEYGAESFDREDPGKTVNYTRHAT
ncbi:hypothetical protein DFH07DRAFT_895197 [Mycena maculata]|uniref:Uncharacterized protein n=1 Tax=Mycena maculata TaxID=230809 RepID=A0AAD7HXD4_9AGAR|nr:hypothetical protein DFH07DRAFT_895197 [Mycena maculata]